MTARTSKITLSKRMPLTIQKDFLVQLRSAIVEKDVESAYKAIFQKYFQSTFPSPYGSDGYIEEKQTSLLNDGLRLLLEVKFGLNLTRANERAKIAAQGIYYLKKFEQDGKQLPNVIVGGDENEMFTLYAPKLYEYLARDYDWSIAPSSAWRENEQLYRELLEDPNLNVFVSDVRSSAFDINELFASINALANQNGEFTKLRVTESNLRLVFDEFTRVVFGGDNWLVGAKKVGVQDTVSIFIQSILGSPDIYIVPTKKNVLHLSNGREITLNASNYDAFFSRYDRKYTVKEIDTITAIADQLIEEVKRRFHGDFWTPTVWADRADNLISSNLGANWREEYIVWDPAAGTKNLTRDYRFNNLYSSTIHQSEIDMSSQYNREATIFQYDFLNDDIDATPESDSRTLKMPIALFQALKDNKPLVFYTNPPYGQATTGSATDHKAGIATTKIGELMNQQEFRKASAELYTQYIYRVQKIVKDFKLTNVHIFYFTKIFHVSSVFDKFNNQFFRQFEFKDGFLFNAGEFQGTSSAWGIVFSHFELKQNDSDIQSSYKYSLEKSGEDGIEHYGTHTIRKLEKDQSIKDWLAEISIPKEEYNYGLYPRTNGGFNLSVSVSKTGTYRKNSIGFIQFNGPNVQRADRYLNLNSTMIELGNQGRCITQDNFERACVTFAAAKSILPFASWVNDKDIFRRPTEAFQHRLEWPEFVHDCVVYSLFHRGSYQTSLREFEYHGNLYNVANEWFFMGCNQIMGLAEKYNLNESVYDARSSAERFVYLYLQGTNLSSEASDLLNQGVSLVKETFKKRFVVAEEYPQWQLLNWDAGYYQVQKIANMYRHEFTDNIEGLIVARNALEAKIRSQVYADEILIRKLHS